MEEEEKLLGNYLDSHPEFLEKWLVERVKSEGAKDKDKDKERDRGQDKDQDLRRLLSLLQRRKSNSSSKLNNNSTTNSSNSSSKEVEDKENVLVTGQKIGGGGGNSGEGVSGEEQNEIFEKDKDKDRDRESSTPRKSSTSSSHTNTPHIRSKRNSISSDRFHTWLSTCSNSSVSTSTSISTAAAVAAAAATTANNNNNNNNNNSSNNKNSNNNNVHNNNSNSNSSGHSNGETPEGNNSLPRHHRQSHRSSSTSSSSELNPKCIKGGGGGGEGGEADGAKSSKGFDVNFGLGLLDQNETFIELVKDISNELNIDCLCHKILVNVSYLTQADRCSLFLARGPADQRYLVAKLFDITVDSGAEESLERARVEEIRIPFGVGIVGNVAQTKEIVNLKNAYEDPRFNYEVDCRTGYTTHSILALPICNNEGDCIGVAQVINKKTGDFSFSDQDVDVFQRYLTFCGIGIQNAQLFETSVAEYRKNQLLLNLARSIFEEQTGLDRLVSKIMKEAQELLECARTIVYLRDVPLYEASHLEKILMMPSLNSSTRNTERKLLTRRESKTVTVREVLREKGLPFDLIFELNMEDAEVRRVATSQLENSPLTQIAQYVARNSEILNIGDAVSWYGQCEEEGGSGGGGELVSSSGSNYSSLPKSILCMPIYNGQRQVIGVAQLINKANNQPFTDSDAITFEAFAIFCGLGIHNTQLYESACKLMAKQSVALDCLSYHATASPEDTLALRRDEIPSCAYFNLFSYAFSDFRLTDSETCKATIRMFAELQLIDKFHIPYTVLCRWILSVKKNYRPVKYHNWRHAFNVAQTMFTVLKTGKMEQFLDDLDILGLMVACLCHDLDHRGTNNAFQQLTASPLAVLYSTSTMEHHHFDQCVMILSSEGNNIFQDLSAENYRKVMKIVEKSILSTDLAMYFRKKDRFIELIDNGEISWQGDDKKELLCGMMMTACDVAAISKPWEIQHKIAKLVADEFFDQGDLEKEQLNQQPVAMMDREKKDELPKMQLSFIDVICLPLYKTLSEIFPWLQPLYDGCLSNKRNWQDLAEKVDMGLTWIDHDFIEKPVEEFTCTNSIVEDVNFVVTTLNCGSTAEGVSSTKSKFKMGRWFRGGKKNWSGSDSTTSSLQSPTRNDNLNLERSDGAEANVDLVIMEEGKKITNVNVSESSLPTTGHPTTGTVSGTTTGSGGLVGSPHKNSPKKSCSIS